VDDDDDNDDGTWDSGYGAAVMRESLRTVHSVHMMIAEQRRWARL